MSVPNVTAGQYLRTKREEKNVPLESVARVTRITLGQLQALERDEFHFFPAEVFVRGYLRNYAKFIELNPEEIIAVYEFQMEAKRNQSGDIQLVETPPPSNLFLKSILDFSMNFISTIIGLPPPPSIGKVLLPPRG